MSLYRTGLGESGSAPSPSTGAQVALGAAFLGALGLAARGAYGAVGEARVLRSLAADRAAGLRSYVYDRGREYVSR